MSNNVSAQIGGVASIQADGSRLWEHVGETATYTSPRLPTSNARALEVDLVMRVVGTGSVTVSIDKWDEASGTWINLLTGAAVITNVTNRYRISPELTAVANSIAQDHLPEWIRIVVTHNNANATTYSLSLTLSQ